MGKRASWSWSWNWDRLSRKGMRSVCVKGLKLLHTQLWKSKQWHESCKKVDVSGEREREGNRLGLRLLLFDDFIRREYKFAGIRECFCVWKRQEAIWHEKKGTRDNLQICQLSYYVLRLYLSIHPRSITFCMIFSVRKLSWHLKMSLTWCLSGI